MRACFVYKTRADVNIVEVSVVLLYAEGFEGMVIVFFFFSSFAR